MIEFTSHITSSIEDTLNSLRFFHPELILGLGFLIMIVAELFLSKRWPQLVFLLALIVVCLSGLAVCFQQEIGGSYFGGMIQLDRMAVLFKLLFCIIAVLIILFVRMNARMQSHAKGTGDFYLIFIAVQLALNLMAMSSNLLMVYISLEMVSLGSYLMVGYLADRPSQAEAAMKYALFGAVCSAIMLYGMSLIYGFTGTLDLNATALQTGLGQIPQPALQVAVFMVLAGIAFKLSLVPFHFWAPDVYEGAATPVTAFLSTAPKIAGFALLIRFMESLKQDSGLQLFDFELVLAIMAIGSMLIGNFGAILQDNVKRMLAYSSIGHTGFLIMALFISTDSGYRALLFYMLIYLIMNIAAFLIADEVEELSGKVVVDEYKGLAKAFPLLMILFVIVLVSLTGIPPTAGFTAKFMVFSAVLEHYQTENSVLILTTIIVATLSTVVSLFYYFRIPLNAFLRSTDRSVIAFKPGAKTILSTVLVTLLIVFMLFPGLITDFL